MFPNRSVGLQEALSEHLDLLRQILSSLEQQHTARLREWEPWRDSAGDVASAAGAAAVELRAVSAGWEYQVSRITVSASGASSSGVIAVYVIPQGSALSGQAQDELYMVDELPAMDGNSPSRGIADEFSPIYLTGNDQLVVSFTGVVASAVVTVRAEGLRRQL